MGSLDSMFSGGSASFVESINSQCGESCNIDGAVVTTQPAHSVVGGPESHASFVDEMNDNCGDNCQIAPGVVVVTEPGVVIVDINAPSPSPSGAPVADDEDEEFYMNQTNWAIAAGALIGISAMALVLRGKKKQKKAHSLSEPPSDSFLRQKPATANVVFGRQQSLASTNVSSNAPWENEQVLANND